MKKTLTGEDLQKQLKLQKKKILNLLLKNRELEAVSYNGKKVYKIYGNVIEKIKLL